MNEPDNSNPYQAPSAPSEIPVQLVPEGGKVKDPSLLGWILLGLLAVSTTFDVIQHVALVFGGDEEMVSEGGGLLVFVIYFVIFLCWSYRVHANARRIDPSVQTVSPGWAVGSYFVPIVCFWVPAQAMIQTSRISGTSVSLVWIWWLGNISLLLIGVAVLAFFLSQSADEIMENFADVGWMDHATIVAQVALAWVEGCLVLGLNRVHRELATRTETVRAA
ncbi:MAG: DUF4328 domain-containing protein [Verrucomicrobiales bacterium]